MAEGRASGRPLWQIVGARIVLFAALAVVIQVGVVLVHYYFDDNELAALMVERETDALSRGVSVEGGRLAFAIPPGLSRFGEDGRHAFVRVRSPEGAVTYSNCQGGCTAHLLPQEVNPPDFWSRLLRPGKPIAVAGGRSFEVRGAKVFIEVAILDDRERVMWRVLRGELFDHLAVPMSLMLVFVLGGMLVSVRFALKPVEDAARNAETIDPLAPSQALATAGMPREIANLGAAVNRLLARTHALMRAQRVYTTAIAHEIRTPLAMAKLELGHIAHPRARKIEQDLDALTHFVTQVTDLGRLESADRSRFETIDLGRLGRAVVSDMAPWVYECGAAIAFVDADPFPAEGNPALVENAVRNLVANAVHHTPASTSIEVVAGPGAAITVSDDAGLYRGSAEPVLEGDGGRRGIGLEIVRRIMTLHRGTLSVAVEPARRTTMRLAFAVPEASRMAASDHDVANGPAPTRTSEPKTRTTAASPQRSASSMGRRTREAPSA